MRFTGAIPVGALLGGYVVRWTGVRVPTVAGLVLAAAGFILMSSWNETIADPSLTLHLALGGFGFGLVIAPLVLSAVESASESYRGTAAAWVTVARMLGMTLGLAALAAWGMGEFQLLTSRLEFPLRFVDETRHYFQAEVVFGHVNRSVSGDDGVLLGIEFDTPLRALAGLDDRKTA